MSSILDVLNNEQQEACKTVDGPVIVYSGAGTGKTRTLTARVAYMVSECHIKPYYILAITFTKKATNEMRERLNTLLADDSHYLNISTIHSLCVKILRHHIDRLGYKKNFEILDDDDSIKAVAEIIKKLDFDKNVISPRSISAIISNFKNGMSQIPSKFMPIYEGYEAELKNNNQLDFDDLLIKVDELFTNYPDVLTYYQDFYRYILVDEFQDTNSIQYSIIKKLASRDKNIFVVGDDDQSIYSFRGATPENMNRFKKDFPGTKEIILNQNYRSSNIILKGANNLINNNTNRVEKNLYSNINGAKDDVVIQQAYFYDVEVNFVCEEIKRLIQEGYCEYKDFAILYRNSAISHNFETTLTAYGIPFNVYGGFSYMKRKEIKDIISYIRFVVDPEKVAHFKRIINIKPRGIGEKTIQKIIDIREQTGLTLLDSIVELCKETQSSKNKALLEFRESIIHLQDILETMSLQEFFDELVAESGILEGLAAEDDLNGTNKVDNVKELSSLIVHIDHNPEYQDYTNADKLREGIDDLILEQSFDNAEKPDAVTISTIHSVKGLEFKVVFVVALEEGIFPSQRDDSEVEEERRCAYVAFTRAKNLLYLTCSEKRMIYGHYVYNKPSRFLREFVYNNASYVDTTINHQKSSSSAYDDIPVTERIYNVGDRVNHKFFGYGKVLSVEDKTIKVIFDKTNEIKTILRDYLGMTVIK